MTKNLRSVIMQRFLDYARNDILFYLILCKKKTIYKNLILFVDIFYIVHQPPAVYRGKPHLIAIFKFHRSVGGVLYFHC